MIDPELRGQLDQLGRELDLLVEPLVRWAAKAAPVLAAYRREATDLVEAPENPVWLVEEAEAARVMGRALGTARLLDEAAGVGDDTGGWAYVDFLLGAREGARLRRRTTPDGDGLASLHELSATEPGEVEARLARLEAEQREVRSLVETLAVALGATGRLAIDALAATSPEAGVPESVAQPQSVRSTNAA